MGDEARFIDSISTTRDAHGRTRQLYGPDGRPLAAGTTFASGGVAGAPVQTWVAAPQRGIDFDEYAPDFDGSPCPNALRTLWWAQRASGVPPPWRFRATSLEQMLYAPTNRRYRNDGERMYASRLVIQGVLGEWGTVLWTENPTRSEDGTVPAWQFLYTDQLVRP